MVMELLPFLWMRMKILQRMEVPHIVTGNLSVLRMMMSLAIILIIYVRILQEKPQVIVLSIWVLPMVKPGVITKITQMANSYSLLTIELYGQR